jgi:branched-chain amino acid aminotransferase
MTRYAFFEGEIRPIEQAKVSIMNQTFNYGVGAFAGLRAYWNGDQRQLYVFRIDDHYRRFLQSASMLFGRLPYSIDELAAITVELLALEGWQQDCYIRPIFYKAEDSVGVRLHDTAEGVAIFSTVSGRFVGEKPISIATSSWRRIDDNVIPARGKIIGAYVNSALTRSEAQMNGFDDALVLDQAGHVVESSVANVFMVRNGALITPPIYDNILEGITRRTIIQLAADELELPVMERSIDRSEIYLADEVFLCGTGMQVVGVGFIDRRMIANGEMGPVTRRLHDHYFRIVRGNDPAYMEWVTPVYRAEAAVQTERVRELELAR